MSQSIGRLLQGVFTRTVSPSPRKDNVTISGNNGLGDEYERHGVNRAELEELRAVNNMLASELRRARQQDSNKNISHLAVEDILTSISAVKDSMMPLWDALAEAFQRISELEKENRRLRCKIRGSVDWAASVIQNWFRLWVRRKTEQDIQFDHMAEQTMLPASTVVHRGLKELEDIFNVNDARCSAAIGSSVSQFLQHIECDSGFSRNSESSSDEEFERDSSPDFNSSRGSQSTSSPVSRPLIASPVMTDRSQPPGNDRFSRSAPVHVLREMDASETAGSVATNNRYDEPVKSSSFEIHRRSKSLGKMMNPSPPHTRSCEAHIAHQDMGLTLSISPLVTPKRRLSLSSCSPSPQSSDGRVNNQEEYAGMMMLRSRKEPSQESYLADLNVYWDRSVTSSSTRRSTWATTKANGEI